ncbi:DUF992 domain-containing protein [Thalassococcus sp. CAU 1522]|uniref:DUF992 domain-containing protein n=1 Tax=Thalassococcus arenae TaxID=2851652 RepID=A0ABS6N6M3_9RHOB|nr:DUF992 domain-containing protein [Thalassococcus arenae]MBV2359673.1 DUF992 domain-containing protein [Thalassococcus arenae]
MIRPTLTIIAGLAVLTAIPVLAQQTVADKMDTVKPASEVQGQQIGTLDCEIEGGWGMFLGSSKGVTCAFTHADGSVEAYTGSMDKLGLDIGKTEKSYMTWVVFTTAENKPGDNALAGTYVGVSAGASLGIGLGANALVGGSDKQIGLQPVSVEGVQGVNLALGLASLTLAPTEG